MRSDNGHEVVAYARQDWLREEKIDTAYIEPGKPWQNGMNERRSEPLVDEEMLRALDDGDDFA